jgi:hypothetical protein
VSVSYQALPNRTALRDPALRDPALRDPATPGLLAPGLLLIALGAGLLAVALSAAGQLPAIIWGSAALGAYCTGLLLITARLTGQAGTGLATWKLGPWTLAWGAVAFGLATMTWTSAQTGPSAEILPGSILRALWMIAVAMTMLAAGYCAGPRRLAIRHGSRVTGALQARYTGQIRSAAVPWALFAVGLVAQAANAALTGHLGFVGDVASSVSSASGYQQYLAVTGECVPLAVAAAAVRAYDTRARGTRLTLVVLFTATMILGAVGGTKVSFVVAILAVVIPRTIARRAVPKGGLAAAILFFLLLVIPFNQAYRDSARGAVTLSTRQAVTAAPAIFRQVVSEDLSPSVVVKSASYLAERIRTIDTPAIIMQRTPGQIPYRSPAELAESPFLEFIPRAVWPGKPILDIGYQVSQQYWELPAAIYTSSDVTPEGDLYRHGGWIPLIAGMFLLGCGMRILDDVADVRRNVHAAFLIILLFPDTVQAGLDWSTWLAGMPGIVALCLVVVACSFRRRPAPDGGPRPVPGGAAHSGRKDLARSASSSPQVRAPVRRSSTTPASQVSSAAMTARWYSSSSSVTRGRVPE